MQIWRLTAVLLGVALLLGGCRVTGELENLAYVLVLGVDRRPDGRLELTARVPQVGKSQAPEGKQGSGSGYLLFSGSGADYPQALEALEQATPRQTNLSHIELLVVSEALASEPGFADLAARIAETPHLYTTARFVVCEGSASDFIDAQETVIGTRLSSEINAMLGHYAERGYIPDSSFADVYYASGSVYGDAVAIRGRVAQATEQPAAALVASPPDADDGQTPMRQRYAGASLLREGVFVGALDARQTRLLNLIRGSASAVPLDCGGRTFTLTPEGGARRFARVDGDAVSLEVRLSFSTLDDVCAEDARELEAALGAELVELVQTCQRLGTDPFGFAESAAYAFSTLDDWLAFGWRDRYAVAPIEARVRIRSAGAD